MTTPVKRSIDLSKYAPVGCKNLQEILSILLEHKVYTRSELARVMFPNMDEPMIHLKYIMNMHSGSAAVHVEGLEVIALKFDVAADAFAGVLMTTDYGSIKKSLPLKP